MLLRIQQGQINPVKQEVSAAGRPMAAHNVQSLPGFLLRLQADPEFLFIRALIAAGWHLYPRAPFNRSGCLTAFCCFAIYCAAIWLALVGRRAMAAKAFPILPGGNWSAVMLC
jgi:hypothetical protein